MEKKKKILLMTMLLTMSLLFSGCGGTGTPAQSAEGTEAEAEVTLEYPEKDIEIVCHTNPGDGADVYVRAVSDSINQNKLLPVLTAVVNKAGGSGANMYNYMMQKKGNPYYMMTAQPNMLTSPIQNNLDVRYTDFTPIARLATEPLVLSVNGNSDYESMADLIEAASAEEKAVTQAGGLAGATEYFLSYQIEQETGVVFNLLPHAGGGSEAMVTLLAGDADFMISNPSEVLGQVEAGKLRILAIGTEERIDLLPDVPTLTEQGINATFGMFRGIAMPGDVDEEVQDYMTKVLKKVTETGEWAKYCADNGLVPAYLTDDEFEAYLDEQSPVFEEVLASYGERLK
ncbi:MAG TPA: tripartite tricarboxylate transporter substrate binding protein [Anaerovoracaceae bacterium]|nr:tripartite tricarboxylate transporter substrate binding protein [Anaerovoracaceae bacterium]